MPPYLLCFAGKGHKKNARDPGPPPCPEVHRHHSRYGWPRFAAVACAPRFLCGSAPRTLKTVVQTQVAGPCVERCQPYENNHIREISGLLQRSCRQFWVAESSRIHQVQQPTAVTC